MVPQDPLLFHRSIEDNIMYWNPNADENAFLDASKKAHAHEFISKLEEWYLSQVGERWVKLSWGEKQRIAIARAIINDPMILLADEPTGNLDPETAFEILEIFKKINKNGTTVIIATHNYDLVKKTDAQILKLDSGKIIKVVLKQKQINTNS